MADGVLDSVILQINGGNNKPNKLYDRELYVDKDNYLWRGKSENDKPGNAVSVRSKEADVASKIEGDGFTFVSAKEGNSKIAGLKITPESLVGNTDKKTKVENVDVKNATFDGISVKSEKVILTTASYGSILPTGEEGQLFFLADTSEN